MRFYGRENETETLRWQLSRARETRVARMVVVTGRRRVGKTTLIRKAFEASEVPLIYCYVTEMSDEVAMAQFLVAQATQRLALRYPPTLSKLADAIEWLLEISQTHPFVLVLDECHLLDRMTGFWSALQRVWDLGKAGSQMLLIMSGSVQTALERIFGNQNEPLFGRADQTLVLQPFTTTLLKQIFEDAVSAPGNPRDLLLFYGVTGGVARYVEFLVDADAVTQERLLDLLFSDRGSQLQKEGDLLLANEFRLSAPLYRSILLRLAAGRSKRTELQDGQSTDISPYLARLETLYGLVSRVQPFLEPSEKRKTRYRVADPYMRFWLRFFCDDEVKALMELQQWPVLRERTEAELSSFLGRTLEDWFRWQFLESGLWTPVGCWWDRRGENEIDLIALNRQDRRIVFAEVKSQAEKLNEGKLRRKAEAFLEAHGEYRDWQTTFLGLTPDDMLTSPWKIE